MQSFHKQHTWYMMYTQYAKKARANTTATAMRAYAIILDSYGYGDRW